MNAFSRKLGSGFPTLDPLTLGHCCTACNYKIRCKATNTIAILANYVYNGLYMPLMQHKYYPLRGELSVRFFHILLVALLLVFILVFQASASLIRDPNEHSAHNAIRDNDLAKVRRYLQNKPDLRESGHLLLHCACMDGKTEIAEYLINEGLDINGRDGAGWTPLMRAAGSRQIKTAGLLIARGADMNICNEDGRTPLHIAAMNDNIELVRLLVEKGAEINIADRYHMSPLSFALLDGKKDTVDFLRENGARETLEGAAETLRAARDGNEERLMALVNGNPELVNVRDEYLNTPLHNAADKGSISAVKALLANGADVNAKELHNDGLLSECTPLHFAVIQNHGDIVKMLIEKGADVNAEMGMGITCLSWAVRKKEFKMMDIILSSGVDVNAKVERRKTVLFTAVRTKDIDVVRYLISRGADVNAMTDFGDTPLHDAAYLENTDIASLLIAHGAHVNTGRKSSSTPLQNAITRQNMAMIKLLLSSGADVNGRNERGGTPLHSAIFHSNREIIDLLASHAARFDVIDEDGQTLLFGVQSRKMIELLIRKGVDVNAADRSGETAFSQAVIMSAPEDTLDTLLRCGASMEKRNNCGMTPLHHAAGRGMNVMAKYLLDRGADIHAKDNQGWTPLHHAASDGSAAVVRLLLSRGAKINETDREGFTPLAVAMMSNHMGIAAQLKSKGGREKVEGAGELFKAVYRNDMAKLKALLDSHPELVKIRGGRHSETPLMIAVQNENRDMVKFLLSRGAEVDTALKDARVWSPLQTAVYEGNPAIAEILINYGADVMRRDPAGQTLLQWAVYLNYPRIAALLRKSGLTDDGRAPETRTR